MYVPYQSCTSDNQPYLSCCCNRSHATGWHDPAVARSSATLTWRRPPPPNTQTPQLGDAEASGGGAPGLADALGSSAKEGAAALSWVGARAPLLLGSEQGALWLNVFSVEAHKRTSDLHDVIKRASVRRLSLGPTLRAGPCRGQQEQTWAACGARPATPRARAPRRAATRTRRRRGAGASTTPPSTATRPRPAASGAPVRVHGRKDFDRVDLNLLLHERCVSTLSIALRLVLAGRPPLDQWCGGLQVRV